jgi:hypothetical protein
MLNEAEKCTCGKPLAVCWPVSQVWYPPLGGELGLPYVDYQGFRASCGNGCRSVEVSSDCGLSLLEAEPQEVH